MNVAQQLAGAVVRGPAAIARMRARGWGWFVAYLAAAGAILGFVAWQLADHRDDIIGAIAGYLFPESWRFAAEMLIEQLVKSQMRDVVVNAVIGAALVIVQVLLFPLKEKVSATFEEEAKLVPEKGRELPLWVEAAEEIQLFFTFLTAQMVIFWIGYPPEPWRKTLAVVLSYMFLFSSFGIDFLSPVLQRHGLKYSSMIKTFARHPFTVMAFGAMFTMPVVIVGKLVTSHPEWGFGFSVGLLFGVNVVCIAWAAVAGTYVGARLLPDARTTRPPSVLTRFAFWIVFLALFGWNAYRFGGIGLSLHHKSQILKCDYSVDWGSVELDKPKLGLSTLFDKKIKVGVSIEVTIRNPTSYDVELEENRLEVKHGKDVVATASLTPIEVPEGKSVTQRVGFPVEVSPSMITKGTSLLEPGEWSITLWLHVAPGFDFPIYLLARS